jgi:hypothetical protein
MARKFFPTARRRPRWVSLEVLSVFYLAFPWPFFLWGWFQPSWATIGTVVIILGLAMFYLSWEPDSKEGSLPLLDLLIILIMALLWCALSGLGGFAFRNAGMMKTDALLAELIFQRWPASYSMASSSPALLTMPLGFFLPAAFVGKLWGWNTGLAVEALWAVIGLSLSFGWFLRLVGRPDPRLLFLFVLFGGLDIIGASFFGGQLPSGTTHLEWWARFWQLPSQTTLLFWMTEVAIPAWLATGLLIWLAFIKREFKNFFFLYSLLPLWSVGVFIGLLPFVGLAVYRTRGKGTKTVQNLLFGSYLLMLGIAFYCTFPTDYSLPNSLLGGVLYDNWPTLILFYLIEFGVYAAVCGRSFFFDWDDSWLMGAVLFGSLSIFPTLFIGNANRIFSDAATPSLFLFCVGLTAALWRIPAGFQRRLLVLLLFIGALPSISEITRAFSYGRLFPTSLDEVNHVDRRELFQEYSLVGPSVSGVRKLFLKQPVDTSRETPPDILPPNAIAVDANQYENISDMPSRVDAGVNLEHQSVILGPSVDSCLSYVVRIPAHFPRARIAFIASTLSPSSDVQVSIDGDFVRKVRFLFTGAKQNLTRTTMDVGYLTAGSHSICLQACGSAVNLSTIYIFNDSREDLVIEAEDNVNETSLNHVVPLYFASGGRIINHDFGASSGHWLQYEFNVDSDVEKGILLISYATERNGVILLPSINGESLGPVSCRNTLGWDAFKDVAVSLPPLKAGPYNLVIRCNGVNVNLDRFVFRLSRGKPGGMAFHNLKPESVGDAKKGA